MDYNQELARTTQMHFQIGIKKSKITIIYNFTSIVKMDVITDFKDKTRYTPYVSLESQISHIATNKV